MSTITKKKLIQVIAQELGLHPNDVRNVVQAFLDRMTDYLANGDRLEFRDFGVFKVVTRKQKVGRNPKDPATPIIIPERAAVTYTAGKKVKKMVEKSVSSRPASTATERSPGIAHPSTGVS